MTNKLDTHTHKMTQHCWGLQLNKSNGKSELLLLTLWSKSSLEVKKHQFGHENPHILWNPRIIIIFRRIRNWRLSWNRWIQSTPSHYLTLWPTLRSQYHIHTGLQCDLTLSDFQIKILYEFLISIHAVCPTHINLHQLITPMLFGGKYKSW
jgi:hypothetical protein